jgi:hypothetical protein
MMECMGVVEEIMFVEGKKGILRQGIYGIASAI